MNQQNISQLGKRTMFEGSRYLFAAQGALVSLLEKGSLDKSKVDLMRDVAHNDWNYDFGVGLIKAKSVENRHVAAAAVFARLAVLADQAPHKTGLTSLEWDMAFREAMLRAGANAHETEQTMAEMKETVQDVHREDPLDFLKRMYTDHKD